jgi:tetratricopeptide (TPR) repeat protein
MSFLNKTIIVCIFGLIFTFPSFAEEAISSSHQADALEAQAVDYIDNDQMEEGLGLMKQALDIDPTPIRHMNYGSILFGNGVVDFKNGNKRQALPTLYEAQNQLAQAIVKFDPQKDAVFLAQSYFLLGEIALNAFSNPAKAKKYYQKALSYYDNLGAKAALENLH